MTYFGREAYEYQQAKQRLKDKEVADITSLMMDAKVNLGQDVILSLTVFFLTLLSGYGVLSQQI